MSLKEYGVWRGRAVRVSAENAQDDPYSPHIHLFYDDGTGGEYDGARRASINVKSASALSELVVWIDLNFEHPIIEQLVQLEHGFINLQSRADGLALDYVRANLIKLGDGRVLPHDVPGAENDILDLLLPLLQAAVERQAVVHLFGEPYLPDRQGIHDIHMNQGSKGRFALYNGIWQDGGLFIQNSDGTYTAVFLAFASQALHTEEETGNALPGSSNLIQLILGHEEEHEDDNDPNGAFIADDLRVAFIAALVNPVGPENTPDHSGRFETVWLMNRSPEIVHLKGWAILNKAEDSQAMTEDIVLAPGEIHQVRMENAPLSNKGGLLTLLDGNGYKVDGVSYTRDQVKKEGYVLLFR